MNMKEVHYDFKQKLNKIDSQKYRNLRVPEIDWKINEAQELIVKMVVEPRIKSQVGFEINQRTIDDFRTIIIDQRPSEYMAAIEYDDSSFIVGLPTDYWFLVNLGIIATKGTCTDVLLYDSQPAQHDDKSEYSSFSKSSFEWRSSNYRFNKEGLRVFTDGTYDIVKVGFEYIKRPVRVHNAQDSIGGTYNTLDGATLTGVQDLEFPEGVHREIVDLAVFITAGDLDMSNYQIKQNKVAINKG